MSGPRYARRYVELARRAGARVLEETMVTGWSAEGAPEVTTPRGREVLEAAAVVLATGCRERPRSARLVPGSRPNGVMTTGELQQLVELHGENAGKRALVVGAEHVSFSALMTLAHGGAKVAGMVTELAHHQSLTVFRAGAAFRYRVPLWTRTAISAIHGRTRVEEVELLDLATGETRTVACDTVVFTGDWIPDHELAVTAGLELDPGTLGPRVDTGLRTRRPGFFAAGNVLHGAEPADVAALSGKHAAASVWSWLTHRGPWPERAVPIVCRPPLHWISPNSVSRTLVAPPRGRFALRASTFLSRSRLEVRQGPRLLWQEHVAGFVPGRSRSLSSAWITQVDPAGGAIDVRLD
jgi:thioredoxin reductase